jgi:uncharacterized protein (DUF488 family)
VSVSRRRIYTIGHTTRTFAELVQALAAWDIETVVDIRSFTRSRTNPQFNAAALRKKLPRHGLDYVELPALGGRRRKRHDVPPERNAGWTHRSFKNYADYAESAEFQAGLADLIELAGRRTCAIMCAEAVWWRCHRRIVADYLITRRVPVFHVFTPTKAERAKRTPFARLDRKSRTLRYPREVTAASARRASPRRPPA